MKRTDERAQQRRQLVLLRQPPRRLGEFRGGGAGCFVNRRRGAAQCGVGASPAISARANVRA